MSYFVNRKDIFYHLSLGKKIRNINDGVIVGLKDSYTWDFSHGCVSQHLFTNPENWVPYCAEVKLEFVARPSFLDESHSLLFVPIPTWYSYSNLVGKKFRVVLEEIPPFDEVSK